MTKPSLFCTQWSEIDNSTLILNGKTGSILYFLGVGNMSHGSLKFKYFEKTTKFKTKFQPYFYITYVLLSTT